jgi:hypothetical protein
MPPVAMCAPSNPTASMFIDTNLWQNNLENSGQLCTKFNGLKAGNGSRNGDKHRLMILKHMSFLQSFKNCHHVL